MFSFPLTKEFFDFDSTLLSYFFGVFIGEIHNAEKSHNKSHKP